MKGGKPGGVAQLPHGAQGAVPDGCPAAGEPQADARRPGFGGAQSPARCFTLSSSPASSAAEVLSPVPGPSSAPQESCHRHVSLPH